MKIAVIGAGAMGLAFMRSWIESSIQSAENLIIIDKAAQRREIIKSELGVLPEQDLARIKEAQLIFIAVKPQDFSVLAEELNAVINQQQLIVSIMAGISLSKLSQSLNGHTRLARVMPNLPIIISSGICAYYADPSLEPVALNILEQLLKAGGEVLRFDDENLLNAVTAISGSGPGYIFYFLNILSQICAEFGFTEEQSRALISKTINGSVELWNKDSRSPHELCELVTSKGGTTEAALSHFDSNQIGKILSDAIKKAKDRAEELAA